MKKKNSSYQGIDAFRLIAAIFVIAIHTSPLSSYSAAYDFALTRILARISVPFFFMVSGFFILSKYSNHADRFWNFIKKTGALYGISMLIYLPLSFYSGYFKMAHLLPNLVKDILFDGTLYHLWYLPASMMGCAISCLLVKKCGFQTALFITLLLYLIGLFGDSYYGLTKQIPLLNQLYLQLFELMDQTRNGLFFAPLFFVLGGILADRKPHLSCKASFLLCFVSLLLLFLEGSLLHRFSLQRYDSMYFLLVPCLFFLFHGLTFLKGHRLPLVRTAALIVYLIHPMIIVFVRLMAKMFHLQTLFIENSLLHFLSVAILSLTFGFFMSYLLEQRKKKQNNLNPPPKDRAYLELNLRNLAHNVRTLQHAMPKGCELMAVVKANAYGHGAFIIAASLERLGVHAFAVATIDEGIALRRFGISGEVLILGYTDPARAKELSKYHLMQTLIDYDYALCLSRQKYPVSVHLKIDTGMHRLGFSHANAAQAAAVFSLPHLIVSGIYTHLCVSDCLEADHVIFTKAQIARFYQLLASLEKAHIAVPKTHIQSSYGLLNYPQLSCSYVRAGIALYGVLSTPDAKTNLPLDLRPVLSLKSHIVLLRHLPQGDSVGYGRAFVAEKESIIAVLPIGYGDGLPRNLSCGNGDVLVRGQLVPIIGRICMDQLIIDVTAVSGVSVGDSATLIGQSVSANLSAETVAAQGDTITNELLCKMSSRLKTRYESF